MEIDCAGTAWILWVRNGVPREIMGNATLMERYELEKPHSLIPHVIPHHE